jgi:error-prone DNA polymerase
LTYDSFAHTIFPKGITARDAFPERRRALRNQRHPPYAELHAASAFSFLSGTALPEDLVRRAAELGLPAVALVDANGVYGAPRLYQEARRAGLKALVGAEVALGEPGRRLTLLVESRRGYRNLCGLLTAAALKRPKGKASASWELVARHAEGLHCLTGGGEGPLAGALERGGLDGGLRELERLAALFPGRLHVELQRHRQREQEHRNRAFLELARRLRLPVVATNGVRYARREEKPLHDVLTAIRHRTSLDGAGRRLEPHRERHLKGAAEMAALFPDLPGAVAAAAELAQRLDFTLADLGYRFPSYPLPPGETAASHLRALTWRGARERFRPLTAEARAQLEKELGLIERLDLAGYFLIVWDIVRFCLESRILVQGRGSAANSAVCYALSITAVDPVKMGLLFERFLSGERGEWPDIDLDLPSGEPRERVIQYVYRTYGTYGAAMTANVVTYRDRSATREVAKAFGFSAEQIERLGHELGTWVQDVYHGDEKPVETGLAAAGLDPEARRVKLFARAWMEIHGLPRHLGQHSGGMVIAAGRLDEVVPLEPATMPGRVVVQWDKDDCADLGILKIDLLGLGMLNVFEEAVPVIRSHEGTEIDLAHLPADDLKVYEMLRATDTVGVFQVESRAQMAALPRNNPRTFYDLVIQGAIVRPGPILGGVAGAYFARRLGQEPVTYPHPSLEPVLARTLGVPIFQEQLLRIAMVAAGFTGGEAEELRRAIGSKRLQARMEGIVERLHAGMAARGIGAAAREQITRVVTSFAHYGFPESHAASFALIAYASAYLKAHHPTAFYLALLNAWPLGFYHPSTLVQDAARHDVEVRPIDVGSSGWECSWEDRAGPPAGAIRLGLRFVQGLRRKAARAIESERGRASFTGVDDLIGRCGLHEDEARTLSRLGAFSSFGLSRRGALWQAARVARPAGPLLDGAGEAEPSPLPEMTAAEETRADFEGARITAGRHPLFHLRPQLAGKGVLAAADLEGRRHGDRVRTAGTVIVRQRPGQGQGPLFVTLEDETGMSQAIISGDLFQKHRQVIVGSPGMVVEGTVQRRHGAVSVRGLRFWPLSEVVSLPSHDFR